MKIVPSEFSNSAWDCFLFSKEIAYKNYQQNIDSDNLLFALIKQDNLTQKILKKNNVNTPTRIKLLKKYEVTIKAKVFNIINDLKLKFLIFPIIF